MQTDNTTRAEPSIARDIAAIGRIAAVPMILQVVAQTTGMRFTAIARVTDTRWTTCAAYDQIDFGLKPGDELVLESTICNEIRQHHQPVVFGHASAHPHFSQHPTPKMYGLESYISIPIFRSDGSFFGTLCAIDPAPAKLDDSNIVKTMTLFAQLIAMQLEAQEQQELTDHALLDAQATALLRDQFIAVLGHDLRTPLQSISMGAEVLEATLDDGRERRIAKHIQNSCRRINDLVHNMLDFARGRLGGGIPIALDRSHDLAGDLEHVISEVQRAHPGRAIEVHSAIKHSVPCDRRRVAQLLSNLVSNAVTHGAPDQPVRVELRSDDALFELVVENGGQPIAADKLARLFQPFTRGDSASPQPGLGLGLYIAAEIAKAHGGVLEVSSDVDRTRFVFRMPAKPPALALDRTTATDALPGPQ